VSRERAALALRLTPHRARQVRPRSSTRPSRRSSPRSPVLDHFGHPPTFSLFSVFLLSRFAAALASSYQSRFVSLHVLHLTRRMHPRAGRLSGRAPPRPRVAFSAVNPRDAPLLTLPRPQIAACAIGRIRRGSSWSQARGGRASAAGMSRENGFLFTPARAIRDKTQTRTAAETGEKSEPGGRPRLTCSASAWRNMSIG
jgi:hypothetical protein